MLWRKPPERIAKVGVEGSNPFARSRFPQGNQAARTVLRGRFLLPRSCSESRGSRGEAAESKRQRAYGCFPHRANSLAFAWCVHCDLRREGTRVTMKAPLGTSTLVVAAWSRFDIRGRCRHCRRQTKLASHPMSASGPCCVKTASMIRFSSDLTGGLDGAFCRWR
jgi:hypothetical protein